MTVLAWADELEQFLDDQRVPAPKCGGTWLYCPHEERFPEGLTWCLFRARRWKTYRRHWRRCHRDRHLG